LSGPVAELLLLDWLRSPAVGLTGAKKGCGQGGCGACTVILSGVEQSSQAVVHRAINSCLRPVCALGGAAIKTIEGTGGPRRPAPANLGHRTSFSRAPVPPDFVSPAIAEAAAQASKSRAAVLADPTGSTSQTPLASGKEAMNQVAYALAMNNGTQCGYCTPGFVMNMSALLAAQLSPSKRQIEDVFDGNICRCTGYRAILTGMKTFAADSPTRTAATRWRASTAPRPRRSSAPRRCGSTSIPTSSRAPCPAR
jgi:xanthine dehydrogenase/oxidase